MEVDGKLEILEKAGNLLSILREKNPLIHHITNPVTMNDSANIVLAMGGSPIMASDPSEVEEVVSMASALVINTGMPAPRKLKSMILAGKKANELRIPVVLDPVGGGLTKLRKETLENLFGAIVFSVIKGNQAEIRHLAGYEYSLKGVDSLPDKINGIEVAKAAAQKHKCIIAMTGKEDIITDGKRTYSIENGHSMLSAITGTGCMSASLIGAFCCVTEDPLLAAVTGMLSMGIAGESANRSLTVGEGIGSFKVRFFDHIQLTNKNILIKEGRIHEL